MNIGDRVLCVRGTEGDKTLTEGHAYTITRLVDYMSNDAFHVEARCGELSGGWYVDRFVPLQHEFNVGDEVKCIEEASMLTEGEIYTIEKIASSNKVDIEGVENEGGWYADRFVLYTKPKPLHELGTMVKCVKGCYPYLNRDEVYTVVEGAFSHAYVYVKSSDTTGRVKGWTLDRFVLHTNRFKVGDVVECTRASTNPKVLKKGEIYTVTSLYSTGSIYVDGSNLPWFSARFELSDKAAKPTTSAFAKAAKSLKMELSKSGKGVQVTARAEINGHTCYDSYRIDDCHIDDAMAIYDVLCSDCMYFMYIEEYFPDGHNNHRRMK